MKEFLGRKQNSIILRDYAKGCNPEIVMLSFGRSKPQGTGIAALCKEIGEINRRIFRQPALIFRHSEQSEGFLKFFGDYFVVKLFRNDRGKGRKCFSPHPDLLLKGEGDENGGLL